MLIGKITQVLRDRRRKEEMARADYWDERARQRSGFARSVWHSESFSTVWDARQREMLRRVLGDLRGQSLADVGCGTGRITRFFASEGARAVGFDFSPETVRAAAEETREAGLEAEFVVADVTSGTLPAEAGTFDAAVAVGCLAVACRDLASLERALTGMRGITKPGGHVVLLEPIHTTRFLGRVLRASVAEWVAAGERAGLSFQRRAGMGFVPARLALSSLELPPWLVSPTFAAGEVALDAVPALERVADYRLLLFRRR